MRNKVGNPKYQSKALSSASVTHYNILILLKGFFKIYKRRYSILTALQFKITSMILVQQRCSLGEFLNPLTHGIGLVCPSKV